MNESVLTHLEEIKNSGLQVIWQTGKYYSAQIQEALKQKGKPENLYVTDFISDMGVAYRAADLVISRAGAGSISEFCLLGKPVILVPSPNVAEDHQTKNALALVNKGAALYVKDVEAKDKLMALAMETVQNAQTLQQLSTNIRTMAFEHSADVIADEVYKLAIQYRDKKK
jgi:UDP-N-acetylglucosamine--N-acetylmuramyl-(pentapeptide) pyrophosphoryl-undecaprenol N-acetylglucosamine transferase